MDELPYSPKHFSPKKQSPLPISLSTTPICESFFDKELITQLIIKSHNIKGARVKQISQDFFVEFNSKCGWDLLVSNIGSGGEDLFPKGSPHFIYHTWHLNIHCQIFEKITNNYIQILKNIKDNIKITNKKYKFEHNKYNAVYVVIVDEFDGDISNDELVYLFEKNCIKIIFSYELNI